MSASLDMGFAAEFSIPGLDHTEVDGLAQASSSSTDIVPAPELSFIRFGDHRSHDYNEALSNNTE